MIKIFQIGFNRCGTTSLYELFKKNGYNSIHWANGELAKTLLNNKNNNLPLLTDINDYVFYSDMEFVSSNQIIEGYKMFDLLDKQYPNSLFILNKRDKTNWINSRLQHPRGEKTYIKRYCDFYSLTEKEIIEMWSNDWDTHHLNVKNYFLNNSRFIEFDIEKDNPNKIYDYLKINGITLNDIYFKKLN